MWGRMILAMPGDGKWLGASHNEAVYKSRTVRVMYHDAGGIAVCYIRSAFLKGEPGEVEALCAVDMSKQEPHPLTGNLRTVGHTKTRQCHFIIE